MKSACGKILILFVLMVCVSMAFAGHGNGREKGKEKLKHEDGRPASVRAHVDVFFDSDRDMIRHHYAAYRDADYRSLPPGLAKRGRDLPPGLEKHLRRNGHLPPGLEKKLYPLPVEIEHRLPPLRSGLIRGMIGGSAVIVDKKTSVIVDIFAIF
jgi:hypothetical protein